MTKTAIPYIRWSTLEQGNNDRSSEERQRATTAAFIASKGWVAADPVIDSGRSAYTGENLTKGELGILSKRLLSGAIDASNTVLVVEELDRLSRQTVGRITQWIWPLLEAGLTIAVANTHQIITIADIESNFGAFVTLMAAAFSGHEFSRKQAERGAGSWAKRRRMFEEEGRATSRHRGRKWLRWNAETTAFEPIPERVAVIEEMFRLRLAGWGKHSIAVHLNEQSATQPEYQPWQSVSKKPKTWTVSAVSRIIQDPAVTGYLQFYKNPRGAEKKVPVGEPVKVYPAVIDEETYARANDARLTEQLKTQGRGRAVANILGRIARCAKCQSIMCTMGTAKKLLKSGEVRSHYYLYCNMAKMTKGEKCDNQTGWSYAKIEKPILDKILPLALDDRYFAANNDEVIKLEGRAAILRRRIVDQTDAAKRILSLIRDGDDDELAREEYDSARDRIKATKAELEEVGVALAEAQGRTTQVGHTIRVADVRERMESDDADERYEARSTAKQALAGLIEVINFVPGSRKAVVVRLRYGMGVMIIHPKSEVFFNSKSDLGFGLTADEKRIVADYRRRFAENPVADVTTKD